MRKRDLTEGDETARRKGAIVRAGIVGTAANLALAVMKAVVGSIAGSMSVTVDAINNLTDAISSVITIAGATFAAKEADYEHPMGHGRMEYVATLVLAMLVTYAGGKSVAEAVGSFLVPAELRYDPLTASLVAVGILAKVGLAMFFTRRGRELGSPVLVATGKDARSDVLLSSGTLVSAVSSMAWGVRIEPVVSLAIAVAVLWSGLGMLREVIDQLVGMRVPRDKVESVMGSMMGFDRVTGVYDLVLHSYGPESHVAVARIGVDPSMTLKEFSLLEREVSERVLAETGVKVDVLGVCYDEGGGRYEAMARSVYEAAEAHDEVMQAHGFILDEERGQARIDIVVGFDEENPDEVAEAVAEEISEAVGYGSDSVTVTVDRNVTDL